MTTMISQAEKREMGMAYCNNKDVFLRSTVGTPHVRIIDTTFDSKSGADVSFAVQNNAAAELWQQAHDRADDCDDYDEELFLEKIRQIAAEIRALAPQTCFIEFDVNPWSWPPQEKILKTLRCNGYKPSPGHDSVIVTGDLGTMRESLGKTVNTPRELSVIRMDESQHGSDFGLVFVEAYGLPPIWGQQAIDMTTEWSTRDRTSDTYLHFIGYYEKEPAAVVTFCLAAGIVGIHVAGTRPQYQKKGLFQELMYTILEEHLPLYSTEYSRYAASARSTSATFFKKHGAVPVGNKYKYLI